MAEPVGAPGAPGVPDVPAGRPGVVSPDPPDGTRADAAAVRDALLNPLQLIPLVLVPLFVVARRAGWVADLPLWVLLGSVVVAQMGSNLAYAVWPAGCPYPRMVARVGVMVCSIGLCVYVTGWGPVFAFGYVFAAAENIRVDGSRVARPAIAWMVLATFWGQLAIGLGWVPTLLPDPEVHGVAVLAVFGSAMVIALLRWSKEHTERVEASLRGSEQRFRALVRHASDVILVVDPDGNVSYASPSIERVLGYAAGTFTSVPAELIHPDDAERARAFFRAAVERPEEVSWSELRLAHADGGWHAFEVGLSNRLDDPNVGGLVCNLHDVSERRLFENELAYQAYHDDLTRLPNRLSFLEQLQQALDERVDVAGSVAGGVAVLFLDLDRFKLVNDSLGHEVGDRLLVDVAERLRVCTRPGDHVARFGGDEFTVLLRGLASHHDAVRVAERVLDALRSPVAVGGRELFVSTSIGIALSNDADDAGDVLRRADVAMYVAKDKGRSRWELFDACSDLVAERLELEAELWQGLERGELVVRFQPELSLDDERVVGCESLVRWWHPTRGLLTPAAFVPVAEESSLILAIDRFVLATACRWARHWSTRAGDRRPVVSVNLSPRFVRQPDAVDDITALIDEVGVDPRCVQLEITERTALDHVDSTLQTLHRLRASGIRVAIDDFGTGYSSLGYLKRLPVDVVKLDRSFVETMHTEESDLAIVQAVITMGHALGMKVTAEGVEREEQAELLRKLGCDTAMGWHWSPALEPEEITARIEGEREGAVVPLRRASGI